MAVQRPVDEDSMRLPVYVAALLSRHDGKLLLTRTAEGKFSFPLGRVEMDDPSPEAALRRIMLANFGMEVQLDVGQPPFEGHVAGERCVLRYIFCGPITIDTPAAGTDGVEWRLISECQPSTFVEPHVEVVKWLVEDDRQESPAKGRFRARKPVSSTSRSGNRRSNKSGRRP